MSLLDRIESVKQAALQELRAAQDLPSLERAKGAFLGGEGQFTALMKELGTLAKDVRPLAGKSINAAKQEMEAVVAEKRADLELRAALPTEPTDFTLPGRRRTLGRLHPLTQVTDDIIKAFRRLGFAVADGPEIEDEYHCFDALNTPADHPARDAQDTFYVAGGGEPGGRVANRWECDERAVQRRLYGRSARKSSNRTAQDHPPLRSPPTPRATACRPGPPRPCSSLPPPRSLAQSCRWQPPARPRVGGGRIAPPPTGVCTVSVGCRLSLRWCLLLL